MLICLEAASRSMAALLICLHARDIDGLGGLQRVDDNFTTLVCTQRTLVGNVLLVSPEKGVRKG